MGTALVEIISFLLLDSWNFATLIKIFLEFQWWNKVQTELSKSDNFYKEGKIDSNKNTKRLYQKIVCNFFYHQSMNPKFWLLLKCKTKSDTKNFVKSPQYWNFIYQTHKNFGGNVLAKSCSDDIFTNQSDFSTPATPAFVSKTFLWLIFFEKLL